MNNKISADPASLFQVPPKTGLFYPVKKDRRYQISVIEHHLEKTKIRFDQWGPYFDQMVCSKSIWAYSHFTPLQSKVRKIPRVLATWIDEIVHSGVSENLSAPIINLNELPDHETISSKHIPTLRFIPVKFQVRWSDLLTSVIDACISHAQMLENWKKNYFAFSNVFYAGLIVEVRSKSSSKRNSLDRQQ